MIRTQIQLTEEQARQIKRLAAERQVSMAAVIREGVEHLLRSSGPALSRADRIRRALEATGRFRSGSADGSTRHDEYLAEQGFRCLPPS